MKRIGLLALAAVAFLVASNVVDGIDHDGATITLESNDPAALRSAVIAKVTSWGGRRVAESSSFGEGARSDLTFRVPAATLEQLLGELGKLGATVSGQEVDVDGAGLGAEASERFDRVQRCLDDVARGAAPADVEGCRDDVGAVRSLLEAGAGTGGETQLVVRIDRTGGSTWPVIAGVLGFLIIAATAAVVVRSARRDPDIDLRVDDVPPHADEVYLRRN